MRAATQQAEPKSERTALLGLKARRDSTVALDAEIDQNVFKAEVTELMARYESISAERQTFRQRLSALNERRIQLLAQRDILNRVKSELHADYEFSVDDLAGDVVECPTCGQPHENSFAQRYAIAQDEARSTDLVKEIADELVEVGLKVADEQKRFDDASMTAANLQDLLSRKRGQLSFADVLERQGVRQFTIQVDNRLTELNAQIEALEREEVAARGRMAEAESPERRSAILEQYRSVMSRFLRELQVDSLGPKDYASIDCVLRETGSDRPRAVLAYMYAILSLVWADDASTRCPIVLDSPNQQDQDRDNHRRMLEFIRDHQPAGAQTILCVVDDCNIDFGGKVVTVTDKDFALSEAVYQEVSAEMSSFENAALS